MNKSLLKQYFLNELTDAQKVAVIDWMKDPANDTALKEWMKENWESLPTEGTGFSSNVNRIWQNVQSSINKEEDNQQEEAPVVPLFQKKKKRYFAAAAAVLILCSSYFVYQYLNNKSGTSSLAAYGNKVSTETNKSSTEKKVMLEDGSMVLLGPNASVSFPNHFDNEKREVSLTGNAFFEVSKNPEKPFIVYSNKIVTKVLGTSFTIRTDSATSNISVAVHTGRVQVFEKNVTNQNQVNAKALTSNGVIITANQQTIYSNSSNSFQTSLVATPLPIPNKPMPIGYFDFNRQPVSLIIEKIQAVYGVEIVLENEGLNKCIFSGGLDEESLYEKLTIVCTAINASYEIAGTKILLKGKGCK